MSQPELSTREYLQTRVNHIVEAMMKEIVITKPADPVSFMQNWLTQNGPKYRDGTQTVSHSSQSKSKKVVDDAESDEDEDDELPEDLPEQKNFKKAPRASVSAEAYGTWNKKGNYVPKVINKSDSQKERINQRLSQAFMFSALDDKEKQIVIDAMEEKRFKAGEWIIQQGEDGDELYVVDSGELDCFKRFTKDGENKYLKTYQPGESFGELALLYNAPRAASIQSKTEAILFALDRECFNNIVKESAVKKRERYEEFLKSVELLDTMDPYERSKIADALKPVKFHPNDYVVRQGEEGDTFFIIEDGQAIATKSVAGQPPETVFKYTSGDYFGELALLKEIPRQANIIAQTELKCVTLDRNSFKRMLGPLEDILKRNTHRYQKFAL